MVKYRMFNDLKFKVMKKLLLVFIFAIATSFVATAQPLKFGVKAGLNLNSTTIKDFGTNDDNIIQSIQNSFNKRTGYHFGLTARLTLIGLYVQGDALYVRNSYSYNVNSNSIVDAKENRLDIPVVAGIKLLFLRVYAGPRFSFNLGNDVVGAIGDDALDWDNRNVGFQAGVGIDLGKKMALDFNYNGYFQSNELTIKNVIDQVSPITVKSNSQYFWLSLSYFF